MPGFRESPLLGVAPFLDLVRRHGQQVLAFQLLKNFDQLGEPHGRPSLTAEHGRNLGLVVDGVAIEEQLANGGKVRFWLGRVAEEVGFEPTVSLHPRRFSRPVP